MQTDAEMPNDETSDSVNDSAIESMSESVADSVTDSKSDSISDAPDDVNANSHSENNSKLKNSKKSRVKNPRAEKTSQGAAKSSKKRVAQILNASREELASAKARDNEVDLHASKASDKLATDDEISESIASVSSATQVAWEAAHLNFEENNVMPETDPEAERSSGKMAADSDSAVSDDEIEETEVDLDSLITASISQMGFAALESSEESENDESSEISFLSGEDVGEEIRSADSGNAYETLNADENSEDADTLTFEASGSEESDTEESEPLADIDGNSVADIEDPADNDADAQPTEFIEADHLVSIVESMLFSTDKPVSIATIKQLFKGSNVRTKDITRVLDILASDYAAPTRGVTLEEINGGFQLRSKVDNGEYLRRLQKSRPFRLSGPALEVMSIVAYKQPVTKHEIDEIRGVESGHLLRALMERGMVNFAGKSDLPGKPMAYGTTRKFLEIFGLRNLKELPTLSEIDEILPQGIGETEEKEKLSDLTGQLSTELTSSYSEGEDELDSINSDLLAIDTTSEFFEQEKVRERDRRDRDRAQDLREKIVMGDDVEEKESRWLDRYEAKLLAVEQAAASGTPISIPNEEGDAAPEIGAALEMLSADTRLEMSAQESSQSPDSPDADISDADISDADISDVSTESPGYRQMEGISLDDMPKFSASDAETEETNMLNDLESVLDWNEDEEQVEEHTEDQAEDHRSGGMVSEPEAEL